MATRPNCRFSLVGNTAFQLCDRPKADVELSTAHFTRLIPHLNIKVL